MRRRNGDGGPRRPRARNETIDAALKDFAALLGVDMAFMKQHERDGVFERFAALHILRRHAPDIGVEDVTRVSTGDVDDNQLDAVAFISEGRLIGDRSEALARIEDAEPLDIEIVAIQITTSCRFDRLKIGGFIRGVHSFLSDAPFFKENPRLTKMRALKDLILRECRERDLPLRLRVRGYYAADSNLPKEGNVLGDFAQGRAILRGLAGVDEAEVEPVDRRRLAAIVAVDRSAHAYATALEDYTGFAPSAHLTRLPSAPGAGDCWIGAVDFRSFLQLLTRDDGQGLKEGVFEHNVRGFLSESDVNARIKDTLLGAGRARFPLLNNGLTIVAETILPEPAPVQGGEARLRLKNFQVVNGLQTTHVLHAARDALAADADRLFVPVKIVATEDEDLRRQIVDATNRQTPIEGLALHANDPKALEIQERIRLREAEAGADWPMIFERRTGLHDPSRRAVDAQRVDLGEALRAFVAVFLDQPHRAESGLAPTLGLIGVKLLLPAQSADAYMVSALLLAQTRRLLDRMRDQNVIDEFAPFEHHLAYAMRLLIEPRPVPDASAPESGAYCEALEQQVMRGELIERAFERALRAVRQARRRLPKSRFKRPMESAALTKHVRTEAERQRRGADGRP